MSQGGTHVNLLQQAPTISMQQQLDSVVSDAQYAQGDFLRAESQRQQNPYATPASTLNEKRRLREKFGPLLLGNIQVSASRYLRAQKNTAGTFLTPAAEMYSKKDAKKIRKDYNNAVASGKTMEIDRSKFSEDFKNEIKKETVKGCEGGVKTQGDLYNKVAADDFTDYEKLDTILKEELAVKYVEDKLPLLLSGMGAWDELEKGIVDQLDAVGHEALAHPLFRLGVSLGMRGIYQFRDRSGKTLGPDQFKKIDDLINQRIMKRTLTGVNGMQEEADQRQALHTKLDALDAKRAQKPVSEREAEVDTMIQRDKNARKYILKSLLLVHLGDFYKNTTTEKEVELKGKKKKIKVTTPVLWYREEGSIASAFAHCSRVMFTLPSEHGFSEITDTTKRSAQQRALRGFREKYTGKQKGINEKTGFAVRGSATHRAEAGTKGKKGKKAEEQKKKLGWFFDQSGINVAVGGLGQAGISQRTLLNDGSCGHLYRYYREGSDSEYGVMMLGFESDAFKKKNQLGHTHGLGNGESASSFGGQRVDEIGDKYGGRTVDCSKLDMVLVGNMFDQIDSLVDSATGDLGASQRLEVVAEILSGDTFKRNYAQTVKFLENLFGGSGQGDSLYRQYEKVFSREEGKYHL